MVRVNSRPSSEKTPDRHQHVVEQGDNRADCEGKFKPEGHVNKDSENADTERPEGILRQLASDQRADALFALHFELPIGDVFLDRAIDLLARVDRAANGDEVSIALLIDCWIGSLSR